jgi:hypothetical protein
MSIVIHFVTYSNCLLLECRDLACLPVMKLFDVSIFVVPSPSNLVAVIKFSGLEEAISMRRKHDSVVFRVVASEFGRSITRGRATSQMCNCYLDECRQRVFQQHNNTYLYRILL